MHTHHDATSTFAVVMLFVSLDDTNADAIFQERKSEDEASRTRSDLNDVDQPASWMYQ